MRLRHFISNQPLVNFFLHFPTRRLVLDPFKSCRIIANAISLKPLITELSPLSVEIRLFGSRGRGSNRPDSDFDLFIVGRDPDKIQKLVQKQSQGFAYAVDSTVYTPEQEARIDQEEPKFRKKLEQGVILWKAPTLH